MPAVHARPLTWLFLIATICVDGALVTRNLTDVEHRRLAAAFFFGQSWALGAWVVGGRMHRLARGAIAVAALLALSSVMLSVLGMPNESSANQWGRALAEVSLLFGFAAIATGLCLTVERWATSSAREARSAGWQFPLAEIFGWMMVVAVASAAMRYANFRFLGSTARIMAFLPGGGAIAGLIYALLRERGAPGTPFRLAAAIVALLTFFTAAGLAGLDRAVSIVLAWAFAYFGGWVFVTWLDQRGPSMPDAEESDAPPPLRIVAAPAEDDAAGGETAS